MRDEHFSPHLKRGKEKQPILNPWTDVVSCYIKMIVLVYYILYTSNPNFEILLLDWVLRLGFQKQTAPILKKYWDFWLNGKTSCVSGSVFKYRFREHFNNICLVAFAVLSSHNDSNMHRQTCLNPLFWAQGTWTRMFSLEFQNRLLLRSQ